MILESICEYTHFYTLKVYPNTEISRCYIKSGWMCVITLRAVIGAMDALLRVCLGIEIFESSWWYKVLINFNLQDFTVWNAPHIWKFPVFESTHCTQNQALARGGKGGAGGSPLYRKINKTNLITPLTKNEWHNFCIEEPRKIENILTICKRKITL